MQQFVLNLLALLLPTQLGLHFWPSFSRVVGIKIDYLSPTLYLSYAVLLVYLLVNVRVIYRFLEKHIKTTALFSLFITLNSYFSISPLNTLVWWLRGVLLFLFVIVLRQNKVKVADVTKPLIFSTIVVVSVQVFQFFTQGSLGGLFYFLGERDFSASTPGISKIIIFGKNLLRVPSIFSHPNSLAGYLLLVFFMIRDSRFKLLVLISLIFTFSRSAALALVAYLFFSKYSKSIITLAMIFSFVILITPNQQLITSNSPYSLFSRVSLIRSTHDILAKYPVVGVGLGNFIPALAQELPGSHLTTEHLQPVHNIFLLLLTELGFPLFALLIYKLLPALRTNNHALITMLAMVSITGFFDHYWLTLPQNQLLLSLLLGIL